MAGSGYRDSYYATITAPLDDVKQALRDRLLADGFRAAPPGFEYEGDLVEFVRGPLDAPEETAYFDRWEDAPRAGRYPRVFVDRHRPRGSAEPYPNVKWSRIEVRGLRGAPTRTRLSVEGWAAAALEDQIRPLGFGLSDETMTTEVEITFETLLPWLRREVRGWERRVAGSTGIPGEEWWNVAAMDRIEHPLYGEGFAAVSVRRVEGHPAATVDFVLAMDGGLTPVRIDLLGVGPRVMMEVTGRHATDQVKWVSRVADTVTFRTPPAKSGRPRGPAFLN